MDKLNGFKIYLLQRGISTGTIEKHLRSMCHIFQHVPDPKKENLEQHFLHIIERGQSESLVNNLVMALKHWGKYTGTQEYEGLKYLRVKETQKATLSDREIELFLDLPCLPTHDQKKHKIYTLFFKILAFSGMRPGEVCFLTIDSLDFGRGVFVLERTKTTPRLVPIAPTLLHDLREYVKNCDDRLFAEITRDTWKHHFTERIKRLGIRRKNLSTYSLRHSFITRMLDEDVNLFKVQKIVGHRQIATTAHYTHLTTKDIVSAIKKDPLSRASVPFYDRMKMFRESVWKLLENYASTPEEEKELIEGLKVF